MMGLVLVSGGCMGAVAHKSSTCTCTCIIMPCLSDLFIFVTHKYYMTYVKLKFAPFHSS